MDDTSYATFLQKANNPPAAFSSSTRATASSADEHVKSEHPFLPLLNNKLADLSAKTFITETDSDFHATFISSSSLPSWSESTNTFPDAEDLESQVDGGRRGKVLTVDEWDKRHQYAAIMNAVKDGTGRDEVKVYIIHGRGGRFEVFILAKMDDGLIGVKAKGVAT